MLKTTLKIVIFSFGLLICPGLSSADSNVNIYINERLIESNKTETIFEGRLMIEKEDLMRMIPEIEYVERKNNKVVLGMSEFSEKDKYLLTPEYVFKGKENEFELTDIDVSYIKKDNKLLLPLRSICEAIGYLVEWNQRDYSVNLIFEPNKISKGGKLKINVIGEVLNYSDVELNIFTKINEIRKMNGLQMLILDDKLSNVARIKAKEMHDEGYYSHYSPKYGDPAIMLEKMDIKYDKVGENIAAEHSNFEQVVRAWMESRTHKQNIIDSGYIHTGVGYYSGDKNYKYYYVQVFQSD